MALLRGLQQLRPQCRLRYSSPCLVLAWWHSHLPRTATLLSDLLSSLRSQSQPTAGITPLPQPDAKRDAAGLVWRGGCSTCASSMPSSCGRPGKDAPRQLDFREQLMHALVNLFGANRRAVQASRGANASVALAHQHYTERSDTKGDCAMCSHRPGHRVQTHSICARCHVHLCAGACFKQYHQ